LIRSRPPAARLAIRLAKRFLQGTWLEEPAKRAHHALTGAKNSLYDALTIAVMRRVLLPDSNAIDVGAFEGGMLKHIVRLAPLGSHIAFEPLPSRYEQLRRAFPRVRVHPCALGDKPGEVTFQHVVRYPALSGLKRRIDLDPSEEIRGERVTVETLDRILPEGFPVALVKIDVEGGELGVFRGGVETFRRTRPIIVFECGLGGADTYGAEPEEIFDLVTESIGLRLSLMDTWLSGRAPLSRGEFGERFRKSLDFYFIAHP
jgi:FkbM family methyltransferase